MYSIFRKILFLFDAEKSHVLSLGMLSLLDRIGLLGVILKRRVSAPVNVMGIDFPILGVCNLAKI